MLDKWIYLLSSLWSIVRWSTKCNMDQRMLHSLNELITCLHWIDQVSQQYWSTLMAFYFVVNPISVGCHTFFWEQRQSSSWNFFDGCISRQAILLPNILCPYQKASWTNAIIDTFAFVFCTWHMRTVSASLRQLHQPTSLTSPQQLQWVSSIHATCRSPIRLVYNCGNDLSLTK